MLKYEYDTARLTITEKEQDKDVEIWIRLSESDDSVVRLFRQIRDHFDNNQVHTDVLFYPHRNHDFQWIVRKDYYVDFILALFKHRLIESVSWAGQKH